MASFYSESESESALLTKYMEFYGALKVTHSSKSNFSGRFSAENKDNKVEQRYKHNRNRNKHLILIYNQVGEKS